MRYEMTPQKIERWIKEGRGQGNGAFYKPWLTVRDVPSQGKSSRILGWHTGRVHHVLSQLEEFYFYLQEWRLDVIDIQEQYPLLPLRETVEIADVLGVAHPRDRKRNLVVLTEDFRVTHSTPDGQVVKVRSIKPAVKLASDRTNEKLKIAEVYWQRRGIDWGVVTDLEICTKFATNVRLLHSYRDPSLLGVTPTGIEPISVTLNQLIHAYPHLPYRHVARSCDDLLSLEPGTSLAITWHLLATRKLSVDMTLPLDPQKPLAWN